MPNAALSLALAATLLTAVAAHAETPPSAAAADGPIASARSDDTADQIAEWLKEASETPAYPASEPSSRPVIDRGIHGEVGFGVGSSGYRSAYGVVTMPVGKSGAATVAVSDTSFRTRGGGRSGGQSLAIALDFSNRANAPPAPDGGCLLAAPGRYVDPAWIPRGRRGDYRCTTRFAP